MFIFQLSFHVLSHLKGHISTESSIYRLASDASGSLLAATTSSKTIQIFDPNSNKQIMSLSGHSDMVRCVTVSDDGKWVRFSKKKYLTRKVLSGSSDGTVKLWSLAMPQLYTYSYDHFHDSVWTIASKDPLLKTFWVGTRSGWVWKLHRGDEEGGEVVAICKESSPVTSLAVKEGDYVWTGADSLRQWVDIPVSHMRPRGGIADENELLVPHQSYYRYPDVFGTSFLEQGDTFQFLEDDAHISSMLPFWDQPCQVMEGEFISLFIK